MGIALSDIIKAGAQQAGLTEEFAEDFRQRLLKNEGLLKEYLHFIRTGSFLGEYKVAELSVADIVVYQIDYFKSAMDQDRLGMKFNPDRMLLLGIDTMLKMSEDPQEAERIRARLLSVSGTDGTEMGTERIV